MRLLNSLVLLAGACGVIARSPQHVGKRIVSYKDPLERMQERSSHFQPRGASSYPTPPKHLTPKSKSKAVEGGIWTTR